MYFKRRRGRRVRELVCRLLVVGGHMVLDQGDLDRLGPSESGKA